MIRNAYRINDVQVAPIPHGLAPFSTITPFNVEIFAQSAAAFIHHLSINTHLNLPFNNFFALKTYNH